MKKFILIPILLYHLLSQAQTVTWSDDIACIITTHCGSCHNNQSSLVEFPLTTYDEVYAYRNFVKYYTNCLAMPHYAPNTKHRRYANEKTLTQLEIDLIAAWVDGGCAKGDTTKAPPTPIYDNIQPTIVSPDVSVKVPDYIIADNESNFRRCFILSSPLSSAMQIKQIEVIPGDLSAIYSIYVYADTSAIPTQLDSGGYGYDNFGGTGSNSAKPLYGWVHDQEPLIFPNNCVLKVDSGSRYILQVEYHEEAGGKLDSTRLNIKYATGAGNRELYVTPLLHHANDLMNGPLIIPIDSVIDFHEQKIINNDITLFSVSPLMHRICMSYDVYAVQPGNDTLRIIEVGDHKEIWSEGTYFFQNPIYLKSGSVLHAFAHYDNTLSNGRNPHNPVETISYGFGENDEEMIFNFSYSPYISGDENIVFDSFPHHSHYQNCSPLHFVTSIFSAPLPTEKDIIVYPNPSANEIHVLSNELLSGEIKLLNILGESLIQQNISASMETTMDISNLPGGIYFLKIQSTNNNKFTTIKIIKQ